MTVLKLRVEHAHGEMLRVTFFFGNMLTGQTLANAGEVRMHVGEWQQFVSCLFHGVSAVGTLMQFKLAIEGERAALDGVVPADAEKTEPPVLKLGPEGRPWPQKER